MLYYQSVHFDERQLSNIAAYWRHDPNKAPRVLFGDNDVDKTRGARVAREGYGGQAKVLGQHDRTFAYGISTTFYQGAIPSLREFQALMDEQFQPILEHLSQGGDVIVPSPTGNEILENVNKYCATDSKGRKYLKFKHNLGTGIANLRDPYLKYIQQRLDELSRYAKDTKTIGKPKTYSLTPKRPPPLRAAAAHPKQRGQYHPRLLRCANPHRDAMLRRRARVAHNGPREEEEKQPNLPPPVPRLTQSMTKGTSPEPSPAPSPEPLPAAQISVFAKPTQSILTCDEPLQVLKLLFRICVQLKKKDRIEVPRQAHDSVDGVEVCLRLLGLRINIQREKDIRALKRKHNEILHQIEEVRRQLDQRQRQLDDRKAERLMGLKQRLRQIRAELAKRNAEMMEWICDADSVRSDHRIIDEAIREVKARQQELNRHEQTNNLIRAFSLQSQRDLAQSPRKGRNAKSNNPKYKPRPVARTQSKNTKNKPLLPRKAARTNIYADENKYADDEDSEPLTLAKKWLRNAQSNYEADENKYADEQDDDKDDEMADTSEPLTLAIVQVYEIVRAVTDLRDTTRTDREDLTDRIDSLLLCYPLIDDIAPINVLMCLALRLFSDNNASNVAALTYDFESVYSIGSPEQCTAESHRLLAWEGVQVRVLKIIEKWVDKYWNEDWRGNRELIEWCKHFLDRVLNHYELISRIRIISNFQSDPRFRITKITNRVINKMNSLDVSDAKAVVNERLRSCPNTNAVASRNAVHRSSKFKPTSRSYFGSSISNEPPPPSFGDVDASLIADHITILTMERFNMVRIHPREFLNQAFEHRDKARRAPNIVKYKDFMNLLMTWVQRSVLAAGRRVDRCKIIRKWIDVEERLRALNNFLALKAVFHGLEANAVWRLKDARQHVRASAKAKHARIKALMKTDRNFKRFRTVQLAAAAVSDPMIPDLGLFLKDMIMMDEARNKNKVDYNSMWRIKGMISEYISHPRMPYRLNQDPMIREWVQWELQASKSVDEEFLYAASNVHRNDD